MSLIDCLGKSKFLTAGEKEAIQAAANKYKAQGLSDQDAAIKAVDDVQAANLQIIQDAHGQAGGGAIPPAASKASTPSPQGSRQYAIAARIEDSDAKHAIKRGVKEAGDTYIPKALEVTEREAKDLIDLYGDKAEGVVRDLTNGITPDTRTALTAQLYQKYIEDGQDAKAVDIAMWQAEQSMQAGRSVNANKIWKMITSSGEDQIVLAIERQRQQQVQDAVGPVQEKLNQSREQIDAEIRRLVEQKVQEGIKERLGRAKLITKEKKKAISEAFDKLKGKVPPGMMMSSPAPLVVQAWNAAIEIAKQAVLTGASIANAVQAAVDYFKDQIGDQKFDEKVFRDSIAAEVENLVPVDASQINTDDIKVPKLTGRKKKEFIQEVVQAYNDGTLTDKRFADLYAKKLGVREFTPAEQKQIRELAEIISVAEKFDAELEKNFTPENIKKHKEYVAAAQKANQQLQEFATAPNNIWDTLISIMQGNLMSSMSLVSNVFYNVTYQPLRFTTTGLATMLDYSITKMAKMGLISKSLEDRSIDFVALQKGYFPGGWNGFMEGLKQVKTGTVANERNLREIASGFSPGRAVERWKEKDRTVAQKINDAVEGTLGWEAEAVFRLLNLGDKPWRRAAESARAYELGKLKGLEGEALQKFMLLPDPESKADIEKAGLEATFQDSGPVGQKLQQGINNFLRMVSEIPILGGPAKLILKSQLPYVKTPWNLIAETMNYAAPPITMAVGLYQIATGNKRSGTMMVSKAIVGAMIQAAAYQLFLEGLLTGDDDREKKKRDFQLSGVTPANSINVSALERVLAGGSAEQKDNDVWVSYSKMGVMGVLLDNHVNTYKGRVAEGIEGSYISDLLTSGPRVASATLDQTFLQGTSALIEALRGGDEAAQERWLLRTTEALGTILYPNTIATVSKASDEYLRDTQDSKFLDKLENVYKTKVFAGGNLPAKVSIWGEKVTGQPEGRNKYFFYLFDPSKFRSVDTDNFKYQLYQSFKTDYDGEWLPSAPQREMSYESSKRKLTPEEYELLSLEVGLSRKALVSGYVNSGSWNSDSVDEKKETLTYLYKSGYDNGKRQFMQDLGLNVKNNFKSEMTPEEIRQLKRHLNGIRRDMTP